MSGLLVENADFVVGEKVLRDASVYIEDGKILWVGKGEVPSGIEKIDARKCAVLPALVNAHTHLPETVLRGLCDDHNLQEWLNDYIWPAENKLKAEDARIAALLGCAELIHNGIGFFVDQYFYAKEIAESAVTAGIKALLCPSVFDNCPEGKGIENQFAIARNFVQEWQGKHERIFTGIGPHAPYTVSDEYLTRIAEFAGARGLHIHIHLSETEWENTESQRKFGETPAERLHRIGLLGEKTLLAHCVHLSQKDVKLIASAKSTILHCPQSNLKLSSGIAKVESFRNSINVLVGTDGNASNNNLDVLEELRTACMLQKYLFGPEAMPLSSAFRMISSNAGLLGCSYRGLIAPGMPADLAVLPLSKSHLQPVHDIHSNIIYSANGTDMRDLIVDGKVVMRDYKIVAFDERRVIEEAGRVAERILEKK
ncbi:MAG: amidohydrolase [Thermoplasmata archaeon]|nr:amidohydrolase [Thermoplasmata archaeon]